MAPRAPLAWLRMAGYLLSRVLAFAFAATFLSFGDPTGASATIGYGYDAPVSAYDGVSHSVDAHTSDATLVASHDVAESGLDTVATATASFSVVLRLSVAANTVAGYGPKSRGSCRSPEPATWTA